MTKLFQISLILGIGVLLLGVFLLFPQEAHGPEKEEETDVSLSANQEEVMENTLKLTSTAFEDGGVIPMKYTCDGDNINPPFEISGVPEDTKSLVLIMDDPDIPDAVKERLGIDIFVHWVAFNIAPDTIKIIEGQEPKGVLGRNSTGNTGYTGSCPPDGEHRYFFKLYALSRMLELGERATKQDVEEAMRGKILMETELIGLYNRNLE